MMRDQGLRVVLLGVLVVAVAACSRQTVYEGMLEGAKNNCRGEMPNEVEPCLQRLNSQTYEEYEQARSKTK